jgi:hypothetical protein
LAGTGDACLENRAATAGREVLAAVDTSFKVANLGMLVLSGEGTGEQAKGSDDEYTHIYRKIEGFGFAMCCLVKGDILALKLQVVLVKGVR